MNSNRTLALIIVLGVVYFIDSFVMANEIQPAAITTHTQAR